MTKKQPKFRGYSLETNSWHYGHGWFEIGYTDEFKQEKGIDDKACLYTEGYPVECELKSMGQFTGLEDKNGKEIYEGDIVSAESYETCMLRHWGKEVDNKVKHYGIKFERGSFRLFDLKTNNWVAVIDHHVMSMANELYVIGNIYENPSLLEVSRE